VWVNRLSGAISNHSNPYQTIHIRRCGFSTPPALLTNDPDAALQFYEEFKGQVIYKSISGVRSIVRRVNKEQLARLPLLRHAPGQFQAFITGDNIRVHTVGNRWIATRIRSEAVDYRYAQQEGLTVAMEPTTLPVAVAEACLRVARRFRLLFAGIDLKEGQDGDYYCFEVNPPPAFQYYQWGGRNPICSALVHLLRQGHNSSVLEDLALKYERYVRRGNEECSYSIQPRESLL